MNGVLVVPAEGAAHEHGNDRADAFSAAESVLERGPQPRRLNAEKGEGEGFLHRVAKAPDPEVPGPVPGGDHAFTSGTAGVNV
jgi:hypothetical protein